MASKWRRGSALAAAVVAAALLAPIAQADTVIINPLFGCAGGTRYVPADSDITLRSGWATVNRGLTRAFEVAEKTTLTVDGMARADADDAVYRTLVEGADGSWVSRWIYPTGITLAAGESFTFVYDSLVSHRLHDGAVKADDHDQRPAFAGPGSIFGGPLPCTVIASPLSYLRVTFTFPDPSFGDETYFRVEGSGFGLLPGSSVEMWARFAPSTVSPWLGGLAGETLRVNGGTVEPDGATIRPETAAPTFFGNYLRCSGPVAPFPGQLWDQIWVTGTSAGGAAISSPLYGYGSVVRLPC